MLLFDLQFYYIYKLRKNKKFIYWLNINFNIVIKINYDFYYYTNLVKIYYNLPIKNKIFANKLAY